MMGSSAHEAVVSTDYLQHAKDYALLTALKNEWTVIWQLLKCFNKIIEIITFNAFLKIVKGIVVWWHPYQGLCPWTEW